MNASMNVQVIMKDGEPEYAILPYEQYQALLQAARQQSITPLNTSQPSTHIKPAPVTPQPTQAAAQLTAMPSATTDVTNSLAPATSPETTKIANSTGPFCGQKVAQLRTRKGLDGKTLARGIGISPLYLSQIETGERIPGDAIWHNIARELQVSMADLKAAE
ncbi:MAG: helix-turn-helix domain-containing protein [Marinobacterium sp.]|nr:helix-turn-helix domain-containing protein [Marinobacterium sp.]